MAGHDSQSFYPSFTSKGLDTSTGQVIDLGALYDKQKRLASDFKIPKTYAEAEDIYGPNLVGAPENIKTMLLSLPEGKVKITRGDKEFLTDSDMPKGFFPRTFAGIADIFQPGKDRDKRGNFPNPFATLSEESIGLPEVTGESLKYSPVQQKVIESNLIDQFGKEPSPTEGLKDSLEAINLYQENQDARQLKKARRMALDSFGTYAATELPRQMFINRAAEIANERFLRTKFALEATPTKIQDIMTAKQAQQGIAALSEAERAKAVAEQQKAANEFGAPQVTLARNVRFANAAFKA